MILIFTGPGKGKTTSAIGQALRVLGQGKKALIIQFIKGEKWPSGEEKIIKKLSPKFKLIKGGKGFVGIMGDRLPIKIHKAAAKKTLALAKKAIASRKFDLIILDEINVALSLKLITIKEILKIINNLPPSLDLILTGRAAPRELIKKADLVTNFQEIKHPFQKGVWGKKGIEY